MLLQIMHISCTTFSVIGTLRVDMTCDFSWFWVQYDDAIQKHLASKVQDV